VRQPIRTPLLNAYLSLTWVARPTGGDDAMSSSVVDHSRVDLVEAARQLEQAAHDAQVACDSIRFGDVDWAHTIAIIARAEVDAAENALRAALARDESPSA
jgi:hypothetical protein